jgi:hypothetical protein
LSFGPDVVKWGLFCYTGLIEAGKVLSGVSEYINYKGELPMSQQPPDWWSRRQGPRLGCADVTIVSIASITAFIVLILVLGKSDFLLERLPGANPNPTVGAGKSSDAEPTVFITPRSIVNPTATPAPPTPTATAAPTPTPTFKRASVKQNCRLRPEATTTQKEIKVLPAGTVVKQLGDEKLNEGVNWLSVEVDDGSNLRGWMQEGCFS